MSIENPFDINGSWKIDPDRRQDRNSGPVTIRQMTKAEKIKYGMTVESEGDMKITKVAVRQMASEGMSNNDIAEHFLPAYPNMTKGRMTAKVFALMSDKLGRPRKKVELVDDERVQSATSITEDVEQAKKQIADATQESTDKIKLSQAVDEMMEMVPDSINHPAHYTAGSIEVIDYLQEKMTPDMFEGFCVGNALKYLSRYRFKGGIEDLKKAEWYLNRIIEVKEVI